MSDSDPGNLRQKTASAGSSVDYLARVEGEGAMLCLDPGRGPIEDVKLKIFEPPRFFEAFLRAARASGRHPTSPRGSAASARSPTR